MRIFTEYASGSSCEKIAHRLNAEGVLPPRKRSAKSGRGGAWSMTAVRGMLHNDTYRGIRYWNKFKWTKVHSTGKRRYEKRPKEEWKKHECPRIVSDELWNRVEKTRRQRNAHVKRDAQGKITGARGANGGSPTRYVLGPAGHAYQRPQVVPRGPERAAPG